MKVRVERLLKTEVIFRFRSTCSLYADSLVEQDLKGSGMAKLMPTGGTLLT